MGFDFDIVYKPGCENKAADALSRRMTYSAISMIKFSDEGWESEVLADPKLKKIMQELVVNGSAHPGYSLQDKKLWYKGKLIISKTSPRVQTLMTEYHNSVVRGHSGFFRTFKRIAALVYWEGMRQDILQFVSACETCQQNKYQALSPAGLLQPLPIPTQVWSDISMDFIEGLPRAQGKNAILVVVDRLTKYAHFIPLSHPFTAKDIADLFVREVVKLHF